MGNLSNEYAELLERVKKRMPNPYPIDLFPMTTKDYVNGRYVYGVTLNLFLEILAEELEDLEEKDGSE